MGGVIVLPERIVKDKGVDDNALRMYLQMMCDLRVDGSCRLEVLVDRFGADPVRELRAKGYIEVLNVEDGWLVVPVLVWKNVKEGVKGALKGSEAKDQDYSKKVDLVMDWCCNVWEYKRRTKGTKRGREQIERVLKAGYEGVDVMVVLEWVKQDWNRKFWHPDNVFRISNFERALENGLRYCDDVFKNRKSKGKRKVSYKDSVVSIPDDMNMGFAKAYVRWINKKGK